MTAFDLHCHSLASDGALTSSQLLTLAQKNGVQCLALTDHDTVAGIKEAQQAAQEWGVKLVTGVEITALWGKLEIHIVALDFDLHSEALLAALQAQQNARYIRAQKIADRLEKLGIGDTLAEIEILAQRKNQAVGRPHFAQILISRGVVKSHNEAFRKYLKVGKPAYVVTPWLNMEQAIQCIHQAGGFAVLAHPCRYKLTRTKLTRLVTDFKSACGDGIEISVPTHSVDDIQFLARLADEKQLYASQGSDFHMPGQRWAELGKIPPLPKLCRPIWEIRQW